jgi:lipase
MPSPLFVTRFGRGAPMICLHGIEAHGLRYVGLASYMPGYQIVAPDLRGHGRSPRTGPYSLDQHVADILPLLEEFGPETTLLGHSYGGRIAWEVARAAPNALSRLILVDPALQLRWPFVAEYIDVAPSRSRWPTRELAYRDMAAKRQPAAHWSVALDAAVGLQQTPEGDLRVAMEDEAFTACWEQVTEPIGESAWRGPTLLLEAGQEKQEFVTPPALQSLRRQLGDQLQHEIVDLPHTIPADGPDILANHIRRFLEA